MKRFIMWFLVKREFHRINDTGLFRIRKAKSGSYYIQKIKYTKRNKRWIVKNLKLKFMNKDENKRIKNEIHLVRY